MKAVDGHNRRLTPIYVGPNSAIHTSWNYRFKSEVSISSAKQRQGCRSHRDIVLDNEPPKRLVFVIFIAEGEELTKAL